MFIRSQSISLKAKILGAFILLTALSIAVIVFYLSEALQSKLEYLFSGQLNNIVDYAADDLNRKIDLRITLLGRVAKTIETQDLQSPARLQKALNRHLPPAALFPLGGGVIDRKGAILAEFEPIVRGRLGGHIKNVELHYRAMDGCVAYVSPPLFGDYSPQPVIGIAVPVCDRNRIVMGAVVGVVPLSDNNLFGQLQKIRNTDGDNLVIVDKRTHTIVSANDKSLILQKSDASGFSLNPDNTSAKKSNNAILRWNGKDVLYGGKDLKAVNWFVMATIPADVALEPVKNLQRKIFAAGLLFIMVTSWLLYAVLSRLLAPLQTASKSVQRMAEGAEPLSTLEITSKDEIGHLVKHFNKLIEERKETVEKLEYLAHHDSLTGLPNRLLTQSRFLHSATYARMHGLRVGLLCLDLDHFKTVNDSFGYAKGDDLIKHAAERLRECIPSMHLVSRLDSDEFLVILRNVKDMAEIESIMNEVLEKFSEPIVYEGSEILITASIGAAVFPDDADDFISLCKKAVSAAGQAKESGRNTFRFYDTHMNVDAVERLLLRSHMKRALEQNEFTLHYQPQIDLSSGEVIGAEALIRWQHPEMGMLPPSLFISVAEDSGLIVPIGEWVIREACRQAAEWRASGLPPLVVAVNLSSIQFKRGNLEQTLADALSASGLEPGYLELELTESILIEDTGNVLAKLKRIKSLGIKLSIDDFGTGYSSLSYLKKLEVDKIKIDQSFVRDLSSDQDDAAIVKAIIHMARSLNLKTIAEGVEDEKTAGLLRLLQCNEVQGYHYAKPMPASKLALYLKTAAAANGAGHLHSA
jgi:diguanylate cyclase (GGDEF)-like protein